MQRKCTVCGKLYTNRGSRCRACVNRAWRLANPERHKELSSIYNKRRWQRIKKPLLDKRCEFCDILFTPNKRVPNQPYCQRLCRDRAWRRDNRELYTTRRKAERERTKEQCYARGMKYHNRIRFGGLRDKVLERDNKTCTDCGTQEKIVVHHIDFSKDNNVMENLETLCRACHIRKHTHVLSRNLAEGK